MSCWRLLFCVEDDEAPKERAEQQQQQIEYNCFCFPVGEEDSVFIPDGEQDNE